MLGWGDAQIETAFQRKWGADSAGLDAVVSFQTLLFPSLVARMLWNHMRSDSSPLGMLQFLWLAAFLAWAPLFIVLAQRRPKDYQRLRTPLVLLARLYRQLTIMHWAALFNREAVGASGLGAWPTTLEGRLGLVLWQPGSMITLLGTYLLPLRYTLPCAAALLAATLHSTVGQCSLECSGAWQAEAAQFYTGLAQHMRWRPWAQQQSGAASAGAAAACAAGTCAAGACRASCVAVHAWFQTALGMLLPLAFTWAVEERSRIRFQRLWLQHYALVGGEPGSSSSPGGSSPGRPAGWPPGAGPRPLPRLVLAAWLLVVTWAVWALLEALLLQ